MSRSRSPRRSAGVARPQPAPEPSSRRRTRSSSALHDDAADRPPPHQSGRQSEDDDPRQLDPDGPPGRGARERADVDARRHVRGRLERQPLDHGPEHPGEDRDRHESPGEEARDQHVQHRQPVDLERPERDHRQHHREQSGDPVCAQQRHREHPGGPRAGMFAVSLLCAYGIAGLLSMMLSMVAFWTLEIDGLTMLYVLVASFLSGALVPVAVFPGVLRTVVEWLPFQATTYVPASIYVGSLTGSAAWRAIGIQLAWVVILGLAAALMWRRAIRRVVVQGG